MYASVRTSRALEALLHLTAMGRWWASSMSKAIAHSARRAIAI